MADIYNDVHRSLLTYCNRFLSRNNISGFTIFDFDTHAVEKKLPDTNLLGITGYSISNMDDHYNIICTIIVCTLTSDDNLMDLRAVIGKLFDELTPGYNGSNLPVVDTSGNTIGYLTIKEDVMVSPVAKTDTRPVQGISINFALGYEALP